MNASTPGTTPILDPMLHTPLGRKITAEHTESTEEVRGQKLTAEDAKDAEERGEDKTQLLCGEGTVGANTRSGAISAAPSALSSCCSLDSVCSVISVVSSSGPSASASATFASSAVNISGASTVNSSSQRMQRIALSRILARHGISVVLPAYNEEGAIGATLDAVHDQLDAWGADFEVIVVNDGSRDRTCEVVDAVARCDPRVRQIVHPTNRGYGGALASGFAAAGKDLTFFMDSDGQFAISDLARLLAHIEEVDAVLGYRIARQDTRMRRFNAWGWKLLVWLALGVRVRDLDCAYKLLCTDFLRRHPPRTASALVNAELLYMLTRTGATYREIGVTHLPRQSGRATGANLRVIARAVCDLFLCAYRWRRVSLAELTGNTPVSQENAATIQSPLPATVRRSVLRTPAAVESRDPIPRNTYDSQPEPQPEPRRTT